MNIEDQTNRKSILISEGLILGYITLLGYVLSFTYEYSYSLYFGIPYYFIRIELSNIFMAIFFVLVFIFFARSVFDFLETIGLIKDNSVGRFHATQVLTTILLIPSVISSLESGSRISLYTLLGFICLTIAIEIISTFVYGKGEKTWNAKRKKLEEKWSQKKDSAQSPFTSKIFNRLLPWGEELPLVIFLRAVILCVIAFNLGQFNATRETKFYTLSTSPERVVIANYGDSLFTVSIDKISRIFNTDLKIISMSELSNSKTDLILERIGPLKQPPILKAGR